MTQLPCSPWHQVSIDFCKVAGLYVLVVIDDYSRFPNIEIVHSTAAKAVIPKLDRTFVAYGVPEVVKTDNGRSFNGHEFAQFADYLGFEFRNVTPLWPEANGEVERFMRCFGKVLRTTTNRKQQMYQFLRNYCATPHSTTVVAPATALFGRPIRVKLPCPVVMPTDLGTPVALREQDTHQKLKMKCRAESKGAIRECEIQVGDTVLVKQPRRGKLSTPYHPTPLIVTDKNQSMLTVEGPNSKVTRNSSHFKRFMTGEPVTPLFRLRNLLLMLTWKPVPCLLHLPRVRSLQTLGLLTLPIVPRPRLKSCFEGLPDCPSLRRDLFKRFDQILFNTYVDYEHCC